MRDSLVVTARIALVAVCALLGSCATRTPAPVVDRKPPPASTAPSATEAAALPPGPAAEPVPGPSPASQPDWRPEFYTVKRGDTLFQIALEHGLDYRELAALNNIENINVIRVGQVLRVRPPAAVDSSPVAGSGPSTAPLVTAPPLTDAKPVTPARTDRPNSESYKTQPKAVRLPYSDEAYAQLQKSAGAGSGSASAPPAAQGMGTGPTAAPALGGAVGVATGSATAGVAAVPSMAPGPLASAGPAQSGVPTTPQSPPVVAGESGASDDQVDWAWPVKGRVISGYSESATLKGIDIGGSKGAPVLATAPGRVVYAGSGLRGYGKLVIVKHNKTYLSAYAHLDEILIREGQNVARGQPIGRMGSTDADEVKLHFEIRALGKPVDPTRFLPKS